MAWQSGRDWGASPFKALGKEQNGKTREDTARAHVKHPFKVPEVAAMTWKGNSSGAEA